MRGRRFDVKYKKTFYCLLTHPISMGMAFDRVDIKGKHRVALAGFISKIYNGFCAEAWNPFYAL
jgi:hypothetical protein